MVRAVVASYVVADILLLCTGGLLIGAGTIWQGQVTDPQPEDDAIGRIMLLERCPLLAVIANGIAVVVAFLVSLPAFMLPNSRTWLKAHSWLVVCCLLYTLVLGLYEWIQTLTTRANIEEMWAILPERKQGALQRKFECCGYLNWTSPMYFPDEMCSNDIVASTREGCVGPFSDYAERWLNLLFTGAFGIVGLDVLVLICAQMLMNSRKEQIRYQLIDQKWGVGNI